MLQTTICSLFAHHLLTWWLQTNTLDIIPFPFSISAVPTFQLPQIPKFTYTLTTRCITDLNYVLMMQGHRDCVTHRMAEKVHHVVCRLQKFPLVDKDQNEPQRRR